MEKITMEKMVNLCKQYGFIYQGSEIYDGLANTWDYGPLGSRLKNNIKDAWRKRFVQDNKNSYELDAAILMNPEVWVASGHVSSFSDPLIDCKECKSRHRADKLIEEFSKGKETGDFSEAYKAFSQLANSDEFKNAALSNFNLNDNLNELWVELETAKERVKEDGANLMEGLAEGEKENISAATEAGTEGAEKTVEAIGKGAGT
jgi:glycyl-tRNA synthetase (class II)